MFIDTSEFFLNRQILLTVFGVAFVIALAMTPLSILLARKIGAIDVPKDNRRMHQRAIPRFGGLAIYAGSMVTMGLFEGNNPSIQIAMLGGTLIYLVGVVDDLRNLHAGIKFFCQLVVAVLMFAMGLRIQFIENYFGEGVWHFGEVVCFVVTVLWIVGVTNTINLVDGLDGLAAGVTAIAAFSTAYIAYIHGYILGMPAVCLAMMALAGACVGFLPFNFSPAKTFMGDGGSQYLGFMIAILSVIGPLKRSTVMTVALPIVILAIPLFDTFFAILRRVVNRKPIMEADKGHLHHRLVASGYGQRRAVLMLYGICGIMGVAAVLFSRDLFKDATALCAIAMMYVYVFLTDASHKMPTIKAVNIAKEERKEGKNEAMKA